LTAELCELFGGCEKCLGWTKVAELMTILALAALSSRQSVGDIGKYVEEIALFRTGVTLSEKNIQGRRRKESDDGCSR
jgi:hypothetical protein